MKVLGMKNNIGLLFSHLHVRESEKFKFNMLEYCLDTFDETDLELQYFLSGHGVRVPEEIQKRFSNIYWEPEIDPNEIGRGHPRFCIQGYEMMKRAGISQTIKLRASDIIQNIPKLAAELETGKIVLTEQTSVDNGIVGDLFMAGPVEEMLSIWKEKAWNYAKSGLYNLFDNISSIAAKNNMSTQKYLEQNAHFVTPQEIGWVTLDNNWNNDTKKPSNPLGPSDVWGIKQGYRHYGGF